MQGRGGETAGPSRAGCSVAPEAEHGLCFGPDGGRRARRGPRAAASRRSRLS